MFSLAILLSSAALLPVAVSAQNATTVSSDGCVSPSTFETCINDAAKAEAACIDMAGNDDLVIACGWANDVDELLCYMSDCWNKVYSCEYQYIASSYLYEHGADTVPFYPAPLNAPGGCSCNMGDILTNASASIDLIQTKCPSYVTDMSASLSDCQCCAWSAAISAFYGICPETDPTQLGLQHLIAEVQEYTAISGDCTDLSSAVCMGQFNIGSADGNTYVDPDHLPSAGTQSLSTTTGSGWPMTSPPGGETMTVTVGSVVHTVTAAAYNAKNADSGTVTDSGSSTKTTSSDGSSSGTSTAGDGSSGDGSSGDGSGGSSTSSGSHTHKNAGHVSNSVPLLVMYASLAFLASLTWL